MANLTNLNNKFLVQTGGNVGINSTSPGEKLEVNGNIQGLDTLILKNSSSGVKWQFYRDGNETLNFRYNNSSSWSANAISIKNNNNVGIGTYEPDVKLHIYNGDSGATTVGGASDELILENDTDCGLTIRSGTSSDGVISFADSGDHNIGQVYYSHSSNSMTFRTNDSTAVTINSSQNVGIGTTSPAQKLVVIGNIGTSGSVLFDDNQGINFGNSNAKIYGSSADGIKFNGSGAEVMRLTQAGNLGIGTTSPAALLDVSSGTTTDVIRFGADSRWGFSRANSDNRYLSFMRNQNGSGTAVWTVDGDNGTVGIGTTTPSDLLHLRTSSGDTALRIETVTGGDPTIYFNSSAANRSGLIRYQDNGTNMGRIEYVHNGDRIDMQAGSATGATMSIKNNTVGIGTTSPDHTLVVQSSTNTNANILAIKDSDGTRQMTVEQDSSGNGRLFVWDTSDANKVLLHTNGNSYFNGGNLGIGTTTPNEKLVVGTTGGTQNIEISNSFIQSFNRSGSPGYASLYFYASGYAFNVGNVGIGTTSPLGKLMVQDDTAGSPTRIIVSNGGTAQSGTAARLSFYEGTSERNYIERRRDFSGKLAFVAPADDNPFVWENASGEFMRFVNSAVLIGQTSNVSTHLLTVNGRIGGPTFSDSYLQFTGGNVLLKANDDIKLGYNQNVIVKQSGSVGIGTTSPAGKLHISDTSTQLILETPNATNDIDFRWRENGVNKWNIRYQNSSSDLQFLNQTDGSTTVQMHLDANANVGINTTTPQTTLEVDGASSAFNAHFGQGTDNQSGVFGGISLGYSEANTSYRKVGIVAKALADGAARQNLHFLVDTVADSGSAGLADTKMMIDGLNGNVGIGTTSPQFPLDIHHGTPELNLYDTSSAGQFRFFLDGVAATIKNYSTNGHISIQTTGTGNVGISKTSPSTTLDVQGVITCGDSTTDGAIRRQHQTFATMKPGPSSGGSIDIMFVDHTHALDITVVAIIDHTNVATGRGYSVAAYGTATTGLTQTSFAGNISALSISYVNTGGSENYVLRVTCTYSGVTAPEICVTATGQSASELRAAT